MSAADLAGKSLEALSMMRNEVFARHGHRFKSPSLARHFAGEPWYQPQVDDAGPLLSEIERKNVALIR
ncbi:MAG: YARHG domain-containing protein [Polyangia bacterium]